MAKYAPRILTEDQQHRLHVAWSEDNWNDMLEAIEAIAEAARMAGQFERDDGTLEGEPAWMDGWRTAMEWLIENKGDLGVALAEEMETRLP